MESLVSLLGFLISILILVTVHEYGHFIAARMFGVKVLCFSVGFGKPIWSYTSPSGTIYCLGYIPLGGYVKLLNTTEQPPDQPLPDSELKHAFDQQRAWKKMVVVLAGPAINVLLTVVLFSWIQFGEHTTIRAILGEIPENTVAYQAGLRDNDTVEKIQNKPIDTWQDFQLAITELSFQQKPVVLDVLNTDNGRKTVTLPPLELPRPDSTGFQSLGLVPWSPTLSPIIGEVIGGSAADLANLLPQDHIFGTQDLTFPRWQDLVNFVQKNPNESIDFFISRGTQTFSQNITLGSHILDGRIVGLLGARVDIPEDAWLSATTTSNRGILEAVGAGVKHTWIITSLILQSLKSMFSSSSSLDQLGGPITIAQQAGSSLQRGFETFVSFLALLSLSLAILNLLPIPLLDGGHAVLYLWEMIKGTPPSETVQLMLQRIGIALITALMIIAFSNDIFRFF